MLNQFYRAKFIVRPTGENAPDYVKEVTASIRNWLEKKYGRARVNSVIPDWNRFAIGGTFGNPDQIIDFYAETVSNRTNSVFQIGVWACRIIEVRKYKEHKKHKSLIVEKWITEIGYYRISERESEFSYFVGIEKHKDNQQLTTKPPLNIPQVARFLLSSDKWYCSLNGVRINADIEHYTPYNGELFGMDACRSILQQQKEGKARLQNQSVANDSSDENQSSNNSKGTSLSFDEEKPEQAIKAKVFLTNTSPIVNNTCPICRSALGKELVNIPVMHTNGDFFRYYSEKVYFCYKCKTAFVSKEVAVTILNKINNDTDKQKTINLENATVRTQAPSREYFFSATLSNQEAILAPEKENRSSGASEVLELSDQSFLGRMGYSVNRDTLSRKAILKKAASMYGKRRVCDHLAFLIATRKAQVNGEKKFAQAIRIWQDDMNYVSRL